MMTSKAKRTAWACLTMCSVAALLLQGRLTAGELPMGRRIGHVCVGDLLVRVDELAASPDGAEGKSNVEGDSCRAPGVPADIPGRHIASARTTDGGGGLLVTRVYGEPTRSMQLVINSFVEDGWGETSASILARSRSPKLPVSRLFRGKSVAFVIESRRGAKYSDILVAIFQRAAEEGDLI